MFRAFVVFVVLFGLSARASADFKNLAAGCIEFSRKVIVPPTPTPSPSQVCDNCNGVGKVGDGTIMLTCPVCNGTGKKVATDVTKELSNKAKLKVQGCPGGICPTRRGFGIFR